jgi:hypothetical protein
MLLSFSKIQSPRSWSGYCFHLGIPFQNPVLGVLMVVLAMARGSGVLGRHDIAEVRQRVHSSYVETFPFCYYAAAVFVAGVGQLRLLTPFEQQ